MHLINHTETDDRFERQVLRATHRLAMGVHVHNWLLDLCAELMLKPVPEGPLPLARREYVPAHLPPKARRSR